MVDTITKSLVGLRDWAAQLAVRVEMFRLRDM